MTFVRTFNPSQSPNFHKIENCLRNLQHPTMKKAFQNKKPLLATRQAKNLRKMLVKAKFQLTPTIVREPRRVGLEPCGRCKFCRLGYIQAATEFTLEHPDGKIKWTYTRQNGGTILSVFPVFYVDEPGLRHFMETRFRLRWKPPIM